MRGVEDGLSLKVIAQTDFGSSEAEIVQVLHAELHPVFGYDSINLQVLEREGWYHSLAIDRGVLLDTRRRLVVESFFADYYRDPKPRVVKPLGASHRSSDGSGVAERPRMLVWLPVIHNGLVIGSVSYQSYAFRDISREEIELLELVHEHLGGFVSDAYLNELNQDVLRTASFADQFSVRLLDWLGVFLPANEQARFVAEELGNLGGLSWRQRVDHLGGLALGVARLAWMMRHDHRRDRA